MSEYFRIDWVVVEKLAIGPAPREENDLVNTVLYSLKDYDDKSDVDFMDICVFEASDYTN